MTGMRSGISMKVSLWFIASVLTAPLFVESQLVATTPRPISQETIVALNYTYETMKDLYLNAWDTFEIIDEFVGRNVEHTGNVDKTGFFNNFIFAYHVGYPATESDWFPAFYHLKHEILRPLEFIRNRQLDFYTMRRVAVQCKLASLSAIPYTPDIEHDCLHGKLVTKVFNGKFLKEIIEAYVSAVFVVVKVVFFALSYDHLNYGFDTLSAEPSIIPVGPFRRMAEEANLDHFEIKRRVEEFQKRIDATVNGVEKDKMKEQLASITKELQEAPYNSVYDNGEQEKADYRDQFARQLAIDFLSDTNLAAMCKESYDTWRATDISKLDPIEEAMRAFYKDNLQVEAITSSDHVTLQSGWDWQYDSGKPSEFKNAHFIRASWEFLDRMLEKLKCVMKETYYFDLRNESLKLTQLDLSTAKLFGGISTTLKKPCRITNESDLVGSCTRENHEICSPMYFSSKLGQNPDFDTHGGISLLRPKYYFQRNDEGECDDTTEIKAFTVPYKACHCGFRLDCGKDLGENLVCQLQEDYVRKQCRGGVGYPCKTLPLAPGRYHESCVSGYCDLEENSCEDKPRREHKSGASGLENETCFATGVLLASLWITYVIFK